MTVICVKGIVLITHWGKRAKPTAWSAFIVRWAEVVWKVAVEKQASKQLLPLFCFYHLPRVPFLASLDDGLQPVRWNKLFPHLVVFGHASYQWNEQIRRWPDSSVVKVLFFRLQYENDNKVIFW